MAGVAPAAVPAGYAGIHGGIVDLLDAARQTAARSVNALMTASYWEIGRRIVEAEQQGKRRAGYGEQLIERLASDLTQQFGRGFSRQNLQQMRSFSDPAIRQTVSGESSEPVRPWRLDELAQVFTLPWSAYVRLLSVRTSMRASSMKPRPCAAAGACASWIGRSAASSTSARRCRKTRRRCWPGRGGQARRCRRARRCHQRPLCAGVPRPQGRVFGSDLEAALIRRLEDFLLELGEGFTFIGRQRRLRIDQTWYRVDLLLFHRKLRCLVIIDLKLGSLTHADVGQMHVLQLCQGTLGLSRGEPAGGADSLCRQGARPGAVCAGGLTLEVMAANYRMVLPDTDVLQKELESTRLLLSLAERFVPRRGSGRHTCGAIRLFGVGRTSVCSRFYGFLP